jgi:hypothetical protein
LHGAEDKSLEGFFEEVLLFVICPAPDFPLLDVDVIGLLLPLAPVPFGDSETRRLAAVVAVAVVFVAAVDGIFICFPDRVVIIFAYLSSLSSLLPFSASSCNTLFCK